MQRVAVVRRDVLALGAGVGPWHASLENPWKHGQVDKVKASYVNVKLLIAQYVVQVLEWSGAWRDGMLASGNGEEEVVGWRGIREAIIVT